MQRLSSRSSRRAANITDVTVTTADAAVGAVTIPKKTLPLRTLGLLVLLSRTAARRRRIQARAAASSDVGTAAQADFMRNDTSAMSYDIFFRLFRELRFLLLFFVVCFCF
jgi:hypothetical protein